MTDPDRARAPDRRPTLPGPDASCPDGGLSVPVSAEELQRALDAGEFRLHFQPVVRMHDGTVTGAEALIRWQHPEHGLLAPAHFIPAAEATGMIVPIGEWVLATGLAHAGSWARARPGFRMSLNVAVSQIRGRHEAFVRSLRRHLDHFGLRAADVCLEITETLALSSTDGDRQAVDAMREIGLAVALDDFARGHANPRVLEEFDLDVLKIDRFHVHAVRALPAAAAVITHMLLLARKLDMTTVAEGIETAADHSALSALGCTHAQGFRYSPAVDGPAFTSLLELERLPAVG